jgi:hypothetical protein
MLHKHNESTIESLEHETSWAADLQALVEELRDDNDSLKKEAREVVEVRLDKERSDELEKPTLETKTSLILILFRDSLHSSQLRGRLEAMEVDLRMARADLEGNEVAMANMHTAMQNLQGERDSEIRMVEQQAKDDRMMEREAVEGRLAALAEVHESNIADVRDVHKKEIRIEKDRLETLNVKHEGVLAENVGLRRSLDEAIKRLQASQEDIVDRVLMKNILLDWHSKKGDERKDVMAVMASLLHFTDEEKKQADLYFERREDKGVMGNLVGNIVAPLPPPVLDVEQLEGENVRDKFVQFLLAESGGD